ncbi:DnaJ domain-containing protein [Leptolyngbya sp. FACHB-36]|uniref:J domain-containing protein n=1 Tax=Leptolyngbya sp. FACHB-36 TaxID=2692808 RepID=UPI0016808828|nr:J domain-containing protein [Leptolyngbya sp. FACHB-36]MBD2021410.1 DnaJ domain-containing protein [Leptolyngbya sp. FACHB-36]
MNLAECYRVLGLKAGASFEQIKASYRRLARQYHPDVNPGDYRAKEKFIEVTAAYKFLLANVTDSAASAPVPPPTSPTKPSTSPAKTVIHKTSPQSQRPRTHSSATVDLNHLSPIEQQLKTSSYEQLQQFLKTRRFPRAIALVEGLAQRLPHDPEVVQWQAIVYQQCGRHLIQEHQLDKARLYLKKALRTDPHNRSLWAEVEKDFRSLEQLF